MSDMNSLPGPETPQMGEPEHRHGWRHSGGWMPGVILIVLGVIFLVSNLTHFNFHNWWAVFILIPAFGAFSSAWERYQRVGQADGKVRQSAIGGVLLVGVAAIFMFNLSWSLFGPVLLILLGVSLLGSEALR
jgi:drug/metabolite transporter (DMT)-like permease